MTAGDRSRLDPSPAQQALTAILGPLEGAQIPGGCDHCDAFQTVHPVMAGCWNIVVNHDDWCPWLAEHKGDAS